ncbi:unnamed protein product [Paramecium octaurelia]|uniref:ADP-ribosylation factor n=1 Tax=Paramecium octaurelia TaxID=43137 RepID=A0A8S1S988_PAROT|nr:unnamed protein product [Paramecium octaurelia]
MGNSFSQFKSNQKPLLLMIGLDGAGKTTILNRLILGKVESYTSTLGFYIENIQSKKLDIISWDIRREDKFKILWKPYLQDTKGIIYVIDCFDKNRMHEAKFELLQLLLDPQLFVCPLLIYANKQDQAKISSEELIAELMIQRISKNYHIQPCCSITGQGLQEGLKWIQEQTQPKLK